MKNPFLIGERIYLRAIERDDLRGPYFDWLNDEEVTQFLESGVFPNTTEAMERYFEDKRGSMTDIMFAICLREDDRMIGTVKLGFVNWVHRTAEFGIMIGAKETWSKGYGTESARLICGYGFRRLNLHKINLGVVSDHPAAVRSYEKVGFVHEGRIRSCLFKSGQYQDKVLMGITQQEFFDKWGTLAPKL